MQKTRDHPNSKSGFVREDVLKAISGFFIILVFIAVISLFSGIGGSAEGSNSKPGGTTTEKIIFVVNDMSFEVPKDTTWEEFVADEKLNTPGFIIQDNNVYLGDSKVMDSETNLPVTSDMPIGSDVVYKDESFVDEPDSGSGDITSGEEETPTMISFTIHGKIYYSPEGWTWEQWVADTTYNTGGYTLEGNYINDGLIGNRVSNDGTFSGGVLATQAIISGKSYEIFYGHGGGSA